MPTIKQQTAARKVLENIRNGTGKTAEQIFKESGYSKVVARKHSTTIMRSDGFKEALAAIDDTKILEKWTKWAVSEKDKRVSMDAGKELFKLKGRYPESSNVSKHLVITQELSKLFDEPDRKDLIANIVVNDSQDSSNDGEKDKDVSNSE